MILFRSISNIALRHRFITGNFKIALEIGKLDSQTPLPASRPPGSLGIQGLTVHVGRMRYTLPHASNGETTLLAAILNLACLVGAG